LSAELLGEAGRNVKCAKCAHRWLATADMLVDETGASPKPPPAAPPPPPVPVPPAPPPPAPPVPETPPSPPDEPEPVPEPEPATEEPYRAPPPIPTEEEIASFQAKPSSAKSTIKWWILLLVIIAGLVGGGVYYSRAIVAVYPASKKLFLAIGMQVDVLGDGLKIAEYNVAQRIEGKNRIVSIKGEIHNTTSRVIDLPLMRGSVVNTKGKELYVWTFKTKEPRVLAGEKVSYQTEVRNPPRGGVNISVTFTTEAEMAAERAALKEARAKK